MGGLFLPRSRLQLLQRRWLYAPPARWRCLRELSGNAPIHACKVPLDRQLACRLQRWSSDLVHRSDSD